MTLEGSGRTALITGASAGIGQAFAGELARRGYDVVLTARRRERLDAVAADLAARYGVRARVVIDDLADPEAPARLAARARDDGAHVDVLVNNAGYGVPGTFLRPEWERHADFLQVMMAAPAELAYRLLPGMIERRWGRIINVASLAGLIPPSAGHTLYAASKAFLIRWSESLAQETVRHGVHVTAVCPGFTYSEFHDVAGTREQVNRLPSFMWLDAASVARLGCDAAARGDVVYVTGGVNRALALLARVLPQPIVQAMVRRNASRFRQT